MRFFSSRRRHEMWKCFVEGLFNWGEVRWFGVGWVEAFERFNERFSEWSGNLMQWAELFDNFFGKLSVISMLTVKFQ